MVPPQTDHLSIRSPPSVSERFAHLAAVVTLLPAFLWINRAMNCTASGTLDTSGTLAFVMDCPDAATTTGIRSDLAQFDYHFVLFGALVLTFFSIIIVKMLWRR
jgi:hypothetical protein